MTSCKGKKKFYGLILAARWILSVSRGQKQWTMEKVAPETIQEIRKRFHQVADKIVACSLPWTPWALTHLLDIDDSRSAIPAELILYQAFVGKGRTGIGQRDPAVQVYSVSCIASIWTVNLLIFVVPCWQGKLCRGIFWRRGCQNILQMQRRTIWLQAHALLYGARRLKGQGFVWTNGWFCEAYRQHRIGDDSPAQERPDVSSYAQTLQGYFQSLEAHVTRHSWLVLKYINLPVRALVICVHKAYIQMQKGYVIVPQESRVGWSTWAGWDCWTPRPIWRLWPKRKAIVTRQEPRQLSNRSRPKIVPTNVELPSWRSRMQIWDIWWVVDM